MVNWRDPEIQLYSAHAALFISHVCTGIYLWEFAVGSSFDWQFLTGRRPFRWTLVPYLLARYFSLIAVLGLSVTSNMFRPIRDCKTWWQVIQAVASIALMASSTLLIIRVGAVAGLNPWVVCFLGCLWAAEAATVAYGITLAGGVYVPTLLICAPYNTASSEGPGLLIALALYLCCLAVLACSLWRTRGLGLWRLLLAHGLVYFVVTIIVFGSTVTLLLLDLNDSLNMILQVPASVSLVICSTRLYRGLVTYNVSTVDGFLTTTATLRWRPASSDRDLERRGEGTSHGGRAHGTAGEVFDYRRYKSGNPA